MIKRPSQEFVDAGLARLRERFPPPPPLHGEIQLTAVPGHDVHALVAADRWQRLRDVFAGEDDDAIVNLLVDDFCQRLGITI